MSNQGFNAGELLKKLFSCLHSKKQQPVEDEYVDMTDCKNPWQSNLERLQAKEHSYMAAETVAAGTANDSLNSFVTNLAKKTVEAEKQKVEKKIEDKNAAQAPGKGDKRMGDKTINDMKSWWNDSLNVPEKEGKGVTGELPGKPRAMKRWFE